MKRIAALLITLSLACTSLFAKGFFESRFFETRVSVPFGVSNNVFALNDVMKEVVVIDLKEISENLVNDGFVLDVFAQPSVGFNFNILGVTVGVNAGVDTSGQIALSRGIFDFLGKGLKVNETLDISVSPSVDIFAFGEVNFGLSLSRLSLYVRPAAFAPIITTAGSSGGVKITNKDDGSIILDLGAKVDVYSPLDFSNGMDSLSNIDPMQIENEIVNNMGFDVAMGASLPLSRQLVVSADVRLPMVPATINNKFAMNFESHTELSAETLKDFKFEQPEPKITGESNLNYKVHRPMKLMVYGDYYPLGNFIDLRAGAGMGLYHPFMDTSIPYLQYYLGATANLIGILKLSLSTEYTDRVFIHQLGTVFSLRFIEVDTGLSIQSSDFAKSFQVSGLGGYVVFCMGF